MNLTKKDVLDHDHVLVCDTDDNFDNLTLPIQTLVMQLTKEHH